MQEQQLPDRIIVGPLVFDIRDDAQSWASVMETRQGEERPGTPYGYTEMGPCVIYLRPDLSFGQKRLTLVHELGHVWLHIADVDLRRIRPAVDVEEVFLEAIAPWLVITLVQNPDLLGLFLPGGGNIAELVTEYGKQQAARVNGSPDRRTGQLPVMAGMPQNPDVVGPLR